MEVWKNPATIATWIGIALAVVLFFGLSIVFIIRSYVTRMIRSKELETKMKMDHQEELMINNIQSQELERSRIASDLHDELISELNRLIYYDYKEEQSEEVTNIIQDCIASARRISHDISPPLIEQQSPLEIIERIIQPYHTDFLIEQFIDIRVEKEIFTETKVQFMRLIQELFMNIKKHAGAKNIEIHLRISQQALTIKISDDGIGFDVEKAKSGMGMKNIEMRCRFLNGLYKIKSSSIGTSTLIIIPAK